MKIDLRRFINLLRGRKDEHMLADYWDNKWPKQSLLYRAQGTLRRDVRNLVLSKSFLLQPIADNLKKSHPDNDTRALEILKLVRNSITYKSDASVHNKVEYWQDPETTYQLKTGDCEDFALLITTLMVLSGIPNYRVKVCAGWVKDNSSDGKGGHAYPIYLSERTNEWYILDGTYNYVLSIASFQNVSHKDLSTYYLDIWWTFNNEFAWAQHSTTIDKL